MTFTELCEEAAQRGFTDMLDGGAQEKRLKRWINQAYRELCDEAPWPFLEKTEEGKAPLTVADLGHVLSVSNLTTEDTMPFLERRRVVALDPSLNDTGTAEYWYRDGETTIKVWPADTTTKFVVRYMKTPAELKEAADKPIVPEPYQDLIVDGAVVRLYKNRDNYEAAQFTRQEWERGVRRMVHSYKPNYDRARSIVKTGAQSDYIG